MTSLRVVHQSGAPAPTGGVSWTATGGEGGAGALLAPGAPCTAAAHRVMECNMFPFIEAVLCFLILLCHAVLCRYVDLPYFIGLAVCTIYIGAHKGLTTRQRQQITMKEVRYFGTTAVAHMHATGTVPCASSHPCPALPHPCPGPSRALALALPCLNVPCCPMPVPLPSSSPSPSPQGLLAPVLASASLFGLYLIIKFLPDLSLQTFLDAYFWLIGSFAAFGAAGPIMRRWGGGLGCEEGEEEEGGGGARKGEGRAGRDVAGGEGHVLLAPGLPRAEGAQGPHMAEHETAQVAGLITISTRNCPRRSAERLQGANWVQGCCCNPGTAPASATLVALCTCTLIAVVALRQHLHSSATRVPG